MVGAVARSQSGTGASASWVVVGAVSQALSRAGASASCRQVVAEAAAAAAAAARAGAADRIETGVRVVVTGEAEVPAALC